MMKITLNTSLIISIVLLLISCSKETPLFSVEDINEIEIICDSGSSNSISNKKEIEEIISKVNKGERKSTKEMELPELNNKDKIIFKTKQNDIVGTILENSVLINGELITVKLNSGCNN